MFMLDGRLVKDTVSLGNFALCRVLLMNDSRYPWLILVPRCSDVSEVFELSVTQQQQLWLETTYVGQALKSVFNADKVNIATLGNVVQQLHMHIVLRMQDDAAWPAPVWGKGEAQPYTADALAQIRAAIQPALAQHWLTGDQVDL